MNETQSDPMDTSSSEKEGSQFTQEFKQKLDNVVDEALKSLGESNLPTCGNFQLLQIILRILQLDKITFEERTAIQPYISLNRERGEVTVLVEFKINGKLMHSVERKGTLSSDGV